MKTSEQIFAEVQSLIKLSADPRITDPALQASVGFASNALLWAIDDNDVPVSALILQQAVPS